MIMPQKEVLLSVCVPTYNQSDAVRKLLEGLRNFVAYGDISEETFKQSVQSYFGFLGHASTRKIIENLKNMIWF